MQKNIWIAAKYLRLSIEDGDKAESESIVNQSILIDNYMKSTSDITIVETFKDDGFSGTDFKRPGFQAMLKAIENKEINCIIVKDLSRFGREHIDVDRYIQKVFPQLLFIWHRLQQQHFPLIQEFRQREFHALSCIISRKLM